MLLYAIGAIIVGVVLTKRGNGLIQQALQSQDEEEKVALEALGNRTRKTGQILYWVGIVSSVGILIFLAVVMSQ